MRGIEQNKFGFTPETNKSVTGTSFSRRGSALSILGAITDRTVGALDNINKVYANVSLLKRRDFNKLIAGSLAALAAVEIVGCGSLETLSSIEATKIPKIPFDFQQNFGVLTSDQITANATESNFAVAVNHGGIQLATDPIFDGVKKVDILRKKGAQEPGTDPLVAQTLDINQMYLMHQVIDLGGQPQVRKDDGSILLIAQKGSPVGNQLLNMSDVQNGKLITGDVMVGRYAQVFFSDNKGQKQAFFGFIPQQLLTQQQFQDTYESSV